MARACALTTVGVLGLMAALDPPFGLADPPVNGSSVTVYRTVVETRTVNRRIEGKAISWWRTHAVRARRDANQQHANSTARGKTIRRLQRDLERRFRPDVKAALAVARIVYGVDQTERARCESHFNPFSVEGHGPVGLLQFVPSTFASTPFGSLSIWDPYAQALAGGWMVAKAGRSSEWACPLGGR